MLLVGFVGVVGVVGGCLGGVDVAAVGATAAGVVAVGVAVVGGGVVGGSFALRRATVGGIWVVKYHWFCVSDLHQPLEQVAIRLDGAPLDTSAISCAMSVFEKVRLLN